MYNARYCNYTQGVERKIQKNRFGEVLEIIKIQNKVDDMIYMTKKMMGNGDKMDAVNRKVVFKRGNLAREAVKINPMLVLSKILQKFNANQIG